MDNRLAADRLRFPRFAAQDGEMLAFPTYPPAPATNNQDKINRSAKEAGAGGLNLRSRPAPYRPASRKSVQHGVCPVQKAGPVFFAWKRAKNLPVPAHSAAFFRAVAAPQSSCAGSGRRDGLFRSNKGIDVKISQ